MIETKNPVGRIDYYGFNGKICESIEYHNEADFVAAIKQDNYYGVPMGITVYSDPVTGRHMDTSWRLDLDPPPQAFSIKPLPEQRPSVKDAIARIHAEKAGSHNSPAPGIESPVLE